MFGWIKAGMVKCPDQQLSISRQLLRPKESVQDDDQNTKNTEIQKKKENRVEFPLTADFPSPRYIQIPNPSSR